MHVTGLVASQTGEQQIIFAAMLHSTYDGLNSDWHKCMTDKDARGHAYACNWTQSMSDKRKQVICAIILHKV